MKIKQLFTLMMALPNFTLSPISPFPSWECLFIFKIVFFDKLASFYKKVNNTLGFFNFIMSDFQKYYRYILPLIEEGYLVEELGDECPDYIKNKDLSRYFSLIAVRARDARLIKITTNAHKHIYELRKIDFDDPSVEVWGIGGGLKPRKEDKRIYKKIGKKFYHLEVGKDYIQSRKVKDVIRYTLWGKKGVMILADRKAYFLESEDLFNNFDEKVKPKIHREMVIYSNGEVKKWIMS